MEENEIDEDEEAYYASKLEEISVTEHPFLELDCNHLKFADSNLYRKLICYPQEVVPTFDLAVNNLFHMKFPSTTLEHQIQVSCLHHHVIICRLPNHRSDLSTLNAAKT